MQSRLCKLLLDGQLSELGVELDQLLEKGDDVTSWQRRPGHATNTFVEAQAEILADRAVAAAPMAFRAAAFIGGAPAD